MNFGAIRWFANGCHETASYLASAAVATAMGATTNRAANPSGTTQQVDSAINNFREGHPRAILIGTGKVLVASLLIRGGATLAYQAATGDLELSGLIASSVEPICYVSATALDLLVRGSTCTNGALSILGGVQVLRGPFFSERRNDPSVVQRMSRVMFVTAAVASVAEVALPLLAS